MKTGAVIISAGLSSRMGKFKPLLAWGSSTVIESIVGKFKEAGVQDIVVVTGFQADRLESVLAKTGVRFVRNERYAETQMFDSACLGFEKIAESCDRSFFMPVDIPLFRPETICQMMQETADILCPSYNGKKGHPVLFSGRMIDYFLQYNGDFGLHGAIEASGAEVRLLEVLDDGILYDMDTIEDYRRLSRRREDS